MSKGVFLLMFLLNVFCLISCSSDSFDDDVSLKTANMLIGEWAELKQESYNSQDELVHVYSGWKEDEAAWIFGKNEYFCYGVYNTEGSYTFVNNTINIKETEAKGSYSVLKLTEDSLVVWRDYADTEYSYQIEYFYRISLDDTEVKVNEDALKFVGTWFDQYCYWYFAPSGNVYVSKEKHINRKNYITKQSWSYDSKTRTLATTVHWNDLNSGTNYTWGNYVHSWTVLTFEDTFWTGKSLYASGKTMTFTKVDEY